MTQNTAGGDNQYPPLSSKKQKPGLFYGYVVVGASFLTMLVLFGAQYSFGIFFKPMLDEFGWSRALTSGVYSMNVIIQGIVTILAGRLNDRFGPRMVVGTSALLLCLGYALMSQVNAVWQIYLFYGFFISLGSCVWVPLVSTCARWFIKRRGMMSGIISSGIGFGMVIFPPVANQLIAAYHWRSSFVIIGVSTAVIMFISAMLLRRDPTQKGLQALGADSAQVKWSDSALQGYTLKEAIRTRQFWILCFTFFTSNFCVQTVVVHMVPHATDIGIGAVAAATIISAVGVLSICSKIGSGAAIDQMGSRRVLIVIPVLIALSFFWLLPANQLWMFYLFALVFAIGYGGSSAIQSPITAEYFGLKSHGAILGMLLIGNFAGGAAGPALDGFIFDSTNSYRWAFIVCAVISLVAFTAILLMKPTKKRGPPIASL
jgi:MFS family permease